MSDVSHWVGVFGRAHPLAVHLPLGFLVALGILELLAYFQSRSLPRPTISVLLWLTAGAAIVTAGSGYALSLEPGYDTPEVLLHMRLGFGVAAASLALAIVHLRARVGTRTSAMVAYRILLALTVMLAIPTGHAGGTITHGEGFLTGPLREGWHTEDRTVRAAPKKEPAPAPGTGTSVPSAPKSPAATPSFARDVAPVLAAKCAACHGESKKKGGLSLANEAEIQAGGRNGPVIVAGDAKASEMIRRMRLGPDDEDHMPPPAKPQPTRDEIDAIEAWIAAGAKFDGAGPATPPTAEVPTTRSREPEVTPSPAESVVDPKAIEALRAKQVHAEPIAKGSNLWLVSFAAVARDTGDAEATALLEPLLPYVADLSLARSKVGDASMKLAARMPNLARLDVRETAVSDAGVAALEGHPQLADLVLARTKLTDAAVQSLVRMRALKRVYVWNSGIGARALGDLRLAREDVAIEAGHSPDARALESEKEITLTKPPVPPAKPAAGGTPDAPTPGGIAPAGQAPVNHASVNPVCPVSGKPVDPAYQVVFKGRVVGFCCSKCPGVFWADPAKYEAKLP